MHVGLFTESFDPVINGVSTSVKTLATELSRAGHTATIIAPEYAGFTDEPRDLPEGVHVRRLPSWRTVFNPQNPFAFPPLSFGPLPGAYRDLSLDLVHTQQPFGIGLHGRVCAHRFGVPLVSTFHTLYEEYAHYMPFVPRAITRRVIARHLARYYQSCAAVVVPSHAAGQVLEGMGVSPERLHVVPTGVPAAPAVLPAARERVRETYSLPPYAPVLLFVGRLAREKNLDLLFDAFIRLSETHPARSPETHPILVLVGSGPYRAHCEMRARQSGLETYIRFAGFLTRQQLAPVYRAATLFVFPSSTETQGVVLSEAQSHGLPCVVVRGGGAAEFVRDGVDALVVPSETGAFTEAVRALLGDAERRQAFSQAALSSPLRPAPEAMAARMLALYQSVIRGNPLRPSAERDTPLRLTEESSGGGT